MALRTSLSPHRSTGPRPPRPARTRRTALLAGACALALAACGGGGGGGGSGADGTDEITLQLNWYPYGEHAPFYYGVEEGIFEEHGISLSIEAGQGSARTVQAVGQRDFDFGWADAPAVLANIDQGVDVRSVAVFLQSTPSAVQVFSDTGIEEPEDLRGRTIAVSAGDAVTLTFPLYLDAVGLAEGDVEQQNLDSAGKNAAMMVGQVDGLIGFAHDQGPTLSDESGKEVNYLRYTDAGLNFFSNGLIAHGSTLADDPELVERMVAATSEAFEAARQSPEDAVAAMDNGDPQMPSAEVLLDQWEATIPLLATENTEGQAPGTTDEADWRQTIETLAEAGLIDEARETEAYFDASFTGGAASEAGSADGAGDPAEGDAGDADGAGDAGEGE
ncbi:NitT/TauT family transport system substrate-binding protein [Streptomyces zhaozhouensis]|uniref:NitT/TauT family transport system substrate-binding protein n=1 Tax=Streptomyces zhaozhouensis TaxID=1300267 RepID=A0A286DLQ4_9ACTN|nr:ABC transporter substrate-binding protein [Streptomyces zhaozhouensis]SOD59551.1 NitT/TauT family transport system substrate-binding protein [Streptomyces zhaozhouensis]